MLQVVELKVRLHCKACEKAVRRALCKIKGMHLTRRKKNIDIFLYIYTKFRCETIHDIIITERRFMTFIGKKIIFI